MPLLETKISAVTVYPDRARLTRRGTLSLEPGPQMLEVADLPLRLNPESVRAAARGTARARLLSVQVKSVFYAETPETQVRELEARIEALQDELDGLDARIELLKKQRANLEAVSAKGEIFATALAVGEMSIESHQTLLDNLLMRAEKLDAEQRQAAANKREVERRLKKLQNDLNQQRSARPRQRYTAWIEVDVLAAGDLSVDLSYAITGAGWKPLYDLRLLEEVDERSLEVVYMAQVTQQTGESWDDVALTLSTARPYLAGRLPELDPWYIQPLPPPRPEPLYRPSEAAPAPVQMRAKAMVEDRMPAAALEEAQAEEVAASVVNSGAAVSYEVPARASIPSDGAPHKVSVARYALPPQLDYVATPKLVEAAYRRARVRNDSAYVLLPGAANLFAGDEFIGSTSLELTAPQGEIELYLGVDDRIKVERELKRREVDKRLIGGKRRVIYGYQLTLENLLPVKAQVRLHDQIPVARHEDIKVKLESVDPRPARQTELNELEWEFNLEPQEKRVVRFDFSVEYPQAMEVLGLP